MESAIVSDIVKAEEKSCMTFPPECWQKENVLKMGKLKFKIDCIYIYITWAFFLLTVKCQTDFRQNLKCKPLHLLYGLYKEI